LAQHERVTLYHLRYVLAICTTSFPRIAVARKRVHCSDFAYFAYWVHPPKVMVCVLPKSHICTLLEMRARTLYDPASARAETAHFSEFFFPRHCGNSHRVWHRRSAKVPLPTTKANPS
jgi:hypothetical protein